MRLILLKYLGLQIGNTIWTKENMRQFLQASRLSEILQSNSLSTSCQSKQPFLQGKNPYYFLFKSADLKNNSAQLDILVPAANRERVWNLHNNFLVSKTADDSFISGHDNAKIFCEWLDGWLSPKTQRIYQLAENSPACTNGLLLKEYIAYLLASCKQINPSSAENFLTRYGCFGADISSALLMTNATEVEAIDNMAIDIKKYLRLFPVPLEELKKQLIDPNTFANQVRSPNDLCVDRANKSTWITLDHFGGGLTRGAALVYELKALGASNVEFNTEKQELSFSWQHPFDNKQRLRKLKLCHMDISSRDFINMPPCDCYMQKSSMYVGFKPVTMVQLKPNASVVFGQVGNLTAKQDQDEDIAVPVNQDYLKRNFQPKSIPRIFSANIHARTADLLPCEGTCHRYGWETQLFKRKPQVSYDQEA